MAKSKAEIKKLATEYDALTPTERKEELELLGVDPADISAIEVEITGAPPVETKSSKPRVGHPNYEMWRLAILDGKLERVKKVKVVNMEAERADRMNTHKFNSKVEFVLVED